MHWFSGVGAPLHLSLSCVSGSGFAVFALKVHTLFLFDHATYSLVCRPVRVPGYSVSRAEYSCQPYKSPWGHCNYFLCHWLSSMRSNLLEWTWQLLRLALSPETVTYSCYSCLKLEELSMSFVSCFSAYSQDQHWPLLDSTPNSACYWPSKSGSFLLDSCQELFGLQATPPHHLSHLRSASLDSSLPGKFSPVSCYFIVNDPPGRLLSTSFQVPSFTVSLWRCFL